MKKTTWLLLLLTLFGSLFLVSCTEKEPSQNETTDLSAKNTDASAEACTFYLHYDGETQQFDAEAVTGLIKNIQSLAWLAPRGGLEMELVSENISGTENAFISSSEHGAEDTDAGSVWLRISGETATDAGDGTSIPETQDILAYIQDADLYLGIQNASLTWEIWKLSGYGDWFEKEIQLFLRVATGL